MYGRGHCVLNGLHRLRWRESKLFYGICPISWLPCRFYFNVFISGCTCIGVLRTVLGASGKINPRAPIVGGGGWFSLGIALQGVGEMGFDDVIKLLCVENAVWLLLIWKILLGSQQVTILLQFICPETSTFPSCKIAGKLVIPFLHLSIVGESVLLPTLNRGRKCIFAHCWEKLMIFVLYPFSPFFPFIIFELKNHLKWIETRKVRKKSKNGYQCILMHYLLFTCKYIICFR